MIALVNGQAVSHTSVADRGFLYGQTVFETIAVTSAGPCLFDRHLERLSHGAEVVGIPFEHRLADLIRDEVLKLNEQYFAEIAGDLGKAVLRVTLSIGEGGRGYLNPNPVEPTRVLSLHGYPDHPKAHWKKGIHLGLASIKLAHQPALAGIKHGNRLEQTIARSQWHCDWQEALVLDQNDQVIEGTQSNVFIVQKGHLKTPGLKQCGVAGVMRESVMEQAQKLGVQSEIVSLSLSDIHAADEVFLSNSLIGLWPVQRFQSTCFSKPTLAPKLLNLLIQNEVVPHI